MSEHVLDLGPDLRLLRIGAGDGRGHWLAPRLFAMDPADLAMPLQIGLVGQ